MWYVMTYQPIDPDPDVDEQLRELFNNVRAESSVQLLQHHWAFETNYDPTSVKNFVDSFFGRTNDRYVLIQANTEQAAWTGRGATDPTIKGPRS